MSDTEVLDLVGIALVVDGSRGHQLVFKYPASNESDVLSKDKSYTVAGPANEEEPHARSVFGFTPLYFADMMSPKAALSGKTFDLEINDLIFISYPTRCPPPPARDLPPAQSTPATQGGRRDTEARVDMHLFNIVFVLTPSHPTKAFTLIERAKAPYMPIALRLSAALHHEQMRCGFMTEEVQMVLDIKDKFADRTARASQELSFDSELTKLVVGRSELAATLVALYDGLRAQQKARGPTSIVRLLINGWVDVSFSLRTAPDPTLPMRPYHTLLLLEAKQSLHARLPADASPGLRTLIAQANPLKSFEELMGETRLSLAHMLRLAGHLQHWRVARVVHKVSTRNIYTVTPNATLDASEEFAKEYPGYRLQNILSMFSVCKPVTQHMTAFVRAARKASSGQMQKVTPGQRSSEQEFIGMIVWLLRRGLIVQLHLYVTMILPDMPEAQDHQPHVIRHPHLQRIEEVPSPAASSVDAARVPEKPESPPQQSLRRPPRRPKTDDSGAPDEESESESDGDVTGDQSESHPATPAVWSGRRSPQDPHSTLPTKHPREIANTLAHSDSEDPEHTSPHNEQTSPPQESSPMPDSHSPLIAQTGVALHSAASAVNLGQEDEAWLVANTPTPASVPRIDLTTPTPTGNKGFEASPGDGTHAGIRPLIVTPQQAASLVNDVHLPPMIAPVESALLPKSTFGGPVGLMGVTTGLSGVTTGLGLMVGTPSSTTTTPDQPAASSPALSLAAPSEAPSATPTATIMENPRVLHRKAYCRQLIADLNATDARINQLFINASVHFTGKLHMDEIMWRENLTRNDLVEVLRTFGPALICTIHTAPAYS